MDDFDKLRDTVLAGDFSAISMIQDDADAVPNVEPRRRGIRVLFKGEAVGWLVPNARFEPRIVPVYGSGVPPRDDAWCAPVPSASSRGSGFRNDGR